MASNDDNIVVETISPSNPYGQQPPQPQPNQYQQYPNYQHQYATGNQAGYPYPPPPPNAGPPGHYGYPPNNQYPQHPQGPNQYMYPAPGYGVQPLVSGIPIQQNPMVMQQAIIL